jgi:hypothetical protein
MLAEQREYAECEIFCAKQEPAEHIPLRAVPQKIASGPDCRVLGCTWEEHMPTPAHLREQLRRTAERPKRIHSAN